MNDNELIDLLKERSDFAVVKTDKEYGNYIYKIAFSILGNNEDTEECKNDVLFKIWETIPPLVPISLKAYIGKITRNLSLDCYRKQHSLKRKAEFTLLLEESGEWISDETNASLGDISESISDYLDTVNDEKQYMFLARY